LTGALLPPLPYVQIQIDRARLTRKIQIHRGAAETVVGDWP